MARWGYGYWACGYWALVGVLVGVGAIGILSIGLPLLVIAAVMAGVGASRPAPAGRAVLAVLGGAAVAPAWLAWLNRGGPGEVCTTTATSYACTQEWSPWPFLGVAVALVVLTATLLWWGGRHRGGVPSP